ncbi:hypothetical protein, partial [Massilia sp. S19_KUP03_FR1]|uniref:hypothetical protein n=1 Tax=Massilia sp. S19_KUP03_FR1 TaxID=3025503 RepID=UPI002FCDB649
QALKEWQHKKPELFVKRVYDQARLDIYERMGEAMSEATSIICTLPENERTAHLHGLGHMMGHLWLKLQLPIVREHSDLDPDGDRFRKNPSEER